MRQTPTASLFCVGAEPIEEGLVALSEGYGHADPVWLRGAALVLPTTRIRLGMNDEFYILAIGTLDLELLQPGYCHCHIKRFRAEFCLAKFLTSQLNPYRRQVWSPSPAKIAGLR